MKSVTSHLVVVLMLCVAVPAQGTGEYAEVQGDKVRVRGGPADFHAVLGLMKKGTVVRVVGKEGEWRRVEVPGGLPVWVSSGKDGRVYVKEARPGEGVVLVNDLMLRGNPSTDFPPIGRLGAGERVVVLDRKDPWVRLLSPEGTRTWIHGRLLAPAADQAAAETAWKEDHARSRRLLLESGVLSKQLLARDEAEKERASRARKAFARYEEERDKAWDRRDTKSLRVDLAKVRYEAPAGHRDRMRADLLLKTLDEWDRTGKALAEAKGRFAEAEAEAKEAEKRYAGSLEELREAIRARATPPDAGDPAPLEPRSPYRARGHVGRDVPVTGIGKGPFHGLTQGGKTQFLLESARYDLADFEGKLIGILEGSEPVHRPGLDVRVINVTRIEILDG